MSVRGFTLLELVVTITVMLVILGVMGLQIPAVSAFKSQGFAGVLFHDLSLTRILSITQNQDYQLVIGASSYQIQNQSGVPFQIPGASSATTTYPTGVTVTPAMTLVFDSTGQPYSSGTSLTTLLTLTVSVGGVNKTVTITPETGVIQ